MKPGILTRNPRDYVRGLVTWNFSFNGHCERIQELNKSDVEGVYGRNQIRIKEHSVLIRCSEWAEGIKVSVTLPTRVRKVIVMQFGGRIMCYATQYGKKVYSGENLENNPFRDKPIRRRRF